MFLRVLQGVHSTAVPSQSKPGNQTNVHEKKHFSPVKLAEGVCVCVCVKYRLGCNNTNTLTGESTNLYNLSGSDSSKINPKSYKVFLSSHPAILGLLILLRMQLQETID